MHLFWSCLFLLLTLQSCFAVNYESAINDVKRELGADFLVDTMGVFVIAGNINDEFFYRVKNGTIRNAYNALYKNFFTIEPDTIIKIYLFKDAETYEGYVKKHFGYTPSTPFGFYVSSEQKLVMNISTGTGTLVHEMVHPLLYSDFPDVPPWFNEGFASLYEQCYFYRDMIFGVANWRLPRLQEAINKSKFPGLIKIMQMNDYEFYGDNQDINYATSRYLCLYLQENNLLKKYYKTFKSNCKDDPTGIKTLKEIFGKSIDEIENEYKDWVLKINYK